MIKTALCSVFLALLLGVQSFALTAFEARDLAKKQVNDTARKSLLQIYGKAGTVGVLPMEWQILFYDPYAAQDGSMVTVSGNAITSIRDGYTQMDQFRVFAYKQEEIIDQSKLKIDSRDLLSILKNSSALKDVKISSVNLWLKKDDSGPLSPAVWIAHLFGPNAKGDKEVEFGYARVSAQTGQVMQLKLDLKAVGK
ncbi:MAG: hypothetical protein PHD76_01090 [Methylacidiphilales bacterium]|nr:hypothetical protein [Candidatus Methylacidiphilales bacterium]